MAHTNANTLTAVGVSGSPAARSKSRTLLEHALSALNDHGADTTLIDLATLPADALLGRRRAPDVDDALEQVAGAAIIVVGTPVYRATYSGLLKVFFDLLPVNGLAGKVAIAIATGGSSAHQLVIDHGLRPLLASVSAVTVPTAIYGTDAAFDAGVPHATLTARITTAVAEAAVLAERIQTPATVPASPLAER